MGKHERVPKTDRIRELNDVFRTTFIGGRVMLTSGINALGEAKKAQVLSAVREFKDFDKDNDPLHEHDFLSVDVDGSKVFAKIDYYDRDIRYGADDPSDPTTTTRIMTIMLAEEY